MSLTATVWVLVTFNLYHLLSRRIHAYSFLMKLLRGETVKSTMLYIPSSSDSEIIVFCASTYPEGIQMIASRFDTGNDCNSDRIRNQKSILFKLCLLIIMYKFSSFKVQQRWVYAWREYRFMQKWPRWRLPRNKHFYRSPVTFSTW